MGTEYKILISNISIDSIKYFGLERLNSFWMIDEVNNIHYFGKVAGSDWPEVTVWTKNGSIGITLNGATNSEAWKEVREFIMRLRYLNPDLKVVDWDSEEIVGDEFFGSSQQ